MQDNKPMKSLDRLAWLLDSSIRVPGTSWRIGLDGLIGLVPGVGDIAAGATSSYILWQAIRLGVPMPVLVRMAINIILESVVGLIPVVGDIFDFAFKANMRNVALMRDYVENPSRVKRRSTATLAIALIGLLLFVGLLIWAIWSIMAFILTAIF